MAYHDQIIDLVASGDQSLDVRLRADYRKKKANAELDLFSLMELFSGGSSHSANTRPRIAVIRLEGAIVSSSGPTSLFSEVAISSDKIVPLIEKLGKDENVKAIVLRVDSPGGSALASDLIWRALEATNKPLVASMGDTAASGGYYISMGADVIFAEPGTLTGSIGVLGGKIALDGLMQKFGVTTSVIQRGKNSGVMSPFAAFSDSERDTMQRMLNDVYKQFTQKAAAGRKMDYTALEALARGRVYTGRQARRSAWWISLARSPMQSLTHEHWSAMTQGNWNWKTCRKPKARWKCCSDKPLWTVSQLPGSQHLFPMRCSRHCVVCRYYRLPMNRC